MNGKGSNGRLRAKTSGTAFLDRYIDVNSMRLKQSMLAYRSLPRLFK